MFTTLQPLGRARARRSRDVVDELRAKLSVDPAA